MLIHLNRSVSKINPKQTRPIFHWLNIIFNKLDTNRRQLVGPDRTCAEWILRNGGIVKFVGVQENVHNYNSLPLENVRFQIEVADASNSSISHYGFDHFVGCSHIRKLILHNCSYLQDEALGMLNPLNGSMSYLQVTSCHNISEQGLGKLSGLTNLSQLVLSDLPYVTNKDAVVANLKSSLTKCNIDFK